MSNHIKPILVSILLLLAPATSLLAQDEAMQNLANKSMRFKVYDGTVGGHKFNSDQDGYYPGKSISAGAESPEGADQPLLHDIDVYVVSRTFSDTLLYWQRTNRKDPLATSDDSLMMSQFFNFYDQYNYKLRRYPDGTYDLQEGFQKAKILFEKFKDFWNFWGDGPEDFELIIHHIGKTPSGSNIQNGAERHRIRDIIKYYSETPEEDRMCRLYYDGKIQGVETQLELNMKAIFVKRVIQKGNTIQFDENFAIAGSPDKRVVIDRFVEQCAFEEDYDDLVDNAYGRWKDETKVDKYAAQAEKILRTHSKEDKALERMTTFVFPGERFEQSMRRRTGFNIAHDTLDYFRRKTEQVFASSGVSDQWKQVPSDTVTMFLDKNLFKNYLSKNKAWWNLEYSFMYELPEDGGEGYELGSEPEYYDLRTHKKDYEEMFNFINEAKKLNQGDPGFIPSSYGLLEEDDPYKEYLIAPYFQGVLLSEDFEHMLELDRAAILPRSSAADTLVRVRLYDSKYTKAFEDMLVNSVKTGDRLYLTVDTLRLNNTVTWELPNPNRYYHMMHINYEQDFAHIVGTEKEVCPCYRTNDMRFMSLSTNFAMPDCPPKRPGNHQVENYRPISPTKEYNSVQKEARLEFERGRVVVDPQLGNNMKELDSLRRIAIDIISDEIQRNRIDTIKVIGISSPEGTSWKTNMQLSRDRASHVSAWVQANCQGTRGAFPYSMDSVATWLDVADAIEEFDPANKAEAEHIREVVGNDDPHNTYVQQQRLGYKAGANKVIDRALERLRKVQVSFVYKAQQEPTLESILKVYRSNIDRATYSAYYYYMLMMSDSISYQEKLQLAREVVARPTLKGDSFTRVKYAENERIQSEQWFDLIRPIAANMLAIEAIKNKKYNLDILKPFIREDMKINTTVFDYEENRPFKYINADFVIYNQLAMLLGIGDDESLTQADMYMQMFQSARISKEFSEKYHPEIMLDLVRCYTQQSYLNDTAMASRIKKTSIINFYVIQLSQIHQEFLFETGQYYTKHIQSMIRQCIQRLGELKRLDDYTAEKLYFEAVTEARYADYIAYEEERSGSSMEEAQQIKERHIDKAVNALVSLFEFDAEMLSFCQGNRYVRGIFRNINNKKKNIDIFLEAVDKYIQNQIKEPEDK